MNPKQAILAAIQLLHFLHILLTPLSLRHNLSNAVIAVLAR